jgi:uncharacterized protein (TIGR00251 family)
MQSSSAGVKLRIHVKPLSKENRLTSEPDGTLVMQVAAPPTKGKANREIIKWLAHQLRTPSSLVQMISGFHSDTKVILIVGMTQTEIAAKLQIAVTK